jgi:hypothetical protein
MQNEKQTKILVDLELLIDLSQTIQLLFNIVKEQNLSQEDLDTLNAAGEMMNSCNERFENAITINSTTNAN